jgi:phage shock protein A
MGIFTRFRDIISANMNAMLDRAEDPEKMIKLMIREMEDTLVEIKASCAGVMAGGKKVRRHLGKVESQETYWDDRARLAVEKGRDDLARQALTEKRRYSHRKAQLEEELNEHQQMIEQYQDDILQLEEKLKTARDKQRMLVQRHIHAQHKKQAQLEIRRANSTEAMLKFDDLEGRIERMESEADLINFASRASLESELDKLTDDDEIEQELRALKQKQASSKI